MSLRLSSNVCNKPIFGPYLNEFNFRKYFNLHSLHRHFFQSKMLKTFVICGLYHMKYFPFYDFSLPTSSLTIFKSFFFISWSLIHFPIFFTRTFVWFIVNLFVWFFANSFVLFVANSFVLFVANSFVWFVATRLFDLLLTRLFYLLLTRLFYLLLTRLFYLLLTRLFYLLLFSLFDFLLTRFFCCQLSIFFIAVYLWTLTRSI